ncbi:MAG: hypothetical protein P1V97_38875 [Planctomycetota bacterium]|nr:hypothetical protein [Planctomycetota bacterium]
MITRIKKKMTASAMVALLLVSQSGCGILMHPERRYESRGEIDPTAVLLDCCWLFVGVLPGVAALGIDIASGGAWFPKKLFALAPGEEVNLRINGDAPADCKLSLRLIGPDGKELATPKHLEVIKNQKVEQIRFKLPANTPENAKLVLAIDGRDQGHWMVTNASQERDVLSMK